MAWQRLAGTARLWVIHSWTVGGVTPSAAASLLMPPAAMTARSMGNPLAMGDLTSMAPLLGNTYDNCKALPKYICKSLISAMNEANHIGKKLQSQADRMGMKPADVAKAFGVKPPSVYDWYAHGRIHKRHYPVLVNTFGQPLEWWLDFSPVATQDRATSVQAQALELSGAAVELARLFDMIPSRDTIKRAQAQMACAQIIFDLLDQEPDERVRKVLDNKTQDS